MEFLVKRKNQLEAVIFSGGEPTIQLDLPDRMKDVRRLGYKIGMHTNGNGPVFEEAAKLCDYILLSHHADTEKLKTVCNAKRVDLSTVVWDHATDKYRNDITPFIPGAGS